MKNHKHEFQQFNHKLLSRTLIIEFPCKAKKCDYVLPQVILLPKCSKKKHTLVFGDNSTLEGKKWNAFPDVYNEDGYVVTESISNVTGEIIKLIHDDETYDMQLEIGCEREDCVMYDSSSIEIDLPKYVGVWNAMDQQWLNEKYPSEWIYQTAMRKQSHPEKKVSWW